MAKQIRSIDISLIVVSSYLVLSFFLFLILSAFAHSSVLAEWNCCGDNSAYEVQVYCDKDGHCAEQCVFPGCPCKSPAPVCASPPPPPPPGGGGGSTCDGTCRTQANCGVTGEVGGNGSCPAGQTCCKGSGGCVGNCGSGITTHVEFAPADGSNFCNGINGVACTTQGFGNLNQPFTGDLFLIGIQDAANPGVFVDTWYANTALAANCAGYQYDAYSGHPLPAQFLDGRTHTLYIYHNNTSRGPGWYVTSPNPANYPDPFTVTCTPPVTINVRAKVITPADTSCAAVIASSTYLPGTAFTFSPVVSPGSKTQVGSTYLTWNAPTGTYTLLSTPPSGYVLQNACYTVTPSGPTNASGTSVTMSAAGTLTWDVGFSLGTPWVQTQGGDVIAKTTIKSLMTSLASPRLFSINGSGGYPGTVLYGSTGASPYDFDADPASQGENYVSSKNWLANEPGDGTSKDPLAIDWYQYFLYQFDLSPLANPTPDYTNPPTPVTKPAGRTAPYFVSGDMTTSGDWVIGATENIVFLVTGNVTIKGKINITPGGFFALIAKGTITIDPTVGGPYTSSAPVVEGFYITSPSGSFITGPSTVAGKERFVGSGSFIAGSFLLQRDLSSIGQNGATSAELFTYNPQLLLRMPEKMKETKITWTEVAP